MNPFPGKNSVLIMDNAKIHRHPVIVETIRERFVAVIADGGLSHSCLCGAVAAECCIYLLIHPTTIPSSWPSPRSKPMSVAMATLLAKD
jgi:hypothetical protein